MHLNKRENHFYHATSKQTWIKSLTVLPLLISAASSVTFNESSLALTQRQQDTNIQAGSTDSSASSRKLQGSVQKVELGLEQLRDVGLDLKDVLKAASMLYDEVTIQPVRIITQPQLVGNGTIINLPIGTQPIGPPQPARKERVDLAINDMKPIIVMLKKNADEFVSGETQLDLPDDVMEKLKPQIQKWIDNVNIIAALQNKLEQITQAPPYDNQAIASLTASIAQSTKDLDKTRLAIYKVIRKEGKRIAASKA